jgi:hypothetical protein
MFSRFYAGVVVGAAVVGALAGALCHTESEARGLREEMAIQTIYVPVGNGGAISEVYHGPNRERQKMYEQIRLIREINHPPRLGQPEKDRIAYEKQQEQLRLRYNPSPAECMQR